MVDCKLLVVNAFSVFFSISAYSKTKPNIVFILTDDQGALKETGAYYNPDIIR